MDSRRYMTEPQFPDAPDTMNEAMSLGGDPARLAAYYDSWAQNYDADVGEHGYGLPPMIVQLAQQFRPPTEDTVVLDVGCGTGLVGAELAAGGYRTIDGVDLSPEMIEVARARSIYRSLTAAVDITKPVSPELESHADIVTVAGVFTVGHVPPEALPNVLTMTKPGGFLIVSARDAYYEATNFKQVSDAMVAADAAELVHWLDDAPYTMDSSAHYGVYRRR